MSLASSARPTTPAFIRRMRSSRAAWVALDPLLRPHASGRRGRAAAPWRGSRRGDRIRGRQPADVEFAGAPQAPAAAAGTGARSRDAGALLDRLRERRLVDLLRARRHRGDRARADPARLPDQRPDLRLHGRDLRRGHRPLPGGGRLVELRPARLQRARLVRGGLGADAQLRHHRRHLGVLRPALPVDLLGAAEDEPVGHHRRRRGDPDPGRDQHRRDQGGGGAERLPRGRRLRDAAAARDHRVRDRLRPAHPDRERPLGDRADLGELRARDPGGDDRLHGDRDRLQPRRGGARPDAGRSRRRSGSSRSPSSRSTSRCR